METPPITLHIALAFDQNYITPFYVLLTSIFINNTEDIIHLHVVATGLTSQEEGDIRAYVESQGGHIFYYTITDESVKDFVLPEGYHFTIATYYRLFLPDLVPSEVKHLLYIDTDISVIKSLRELYTLDLGQLPAAAAVDTQMLVRSDLEIYDKNDYFNAGVLLINVPQWQTQQVSEKAIHFLKTYPEKIKFVDQDALNVVLRNNWLRLDNRFNLMQADVPYKPQSEIELFLKDKVIIHYTGKKPWQYDCTNRLKYIYYYYFRKSPRAKEGKYLSYKANPQALATIFKIRALDLYFEYPIISSSWNKLKKILKH